MSTDGTQPPSIAPKRPVPKGSGTGTAVRSSEAPAKPASGATTTSGGATAGTAGTAGATEEKPSLTERLKQGAQGAVDAARSAVPTRDDEREKTPSTPVRQSATARATGASTTKSATTTTSGGVGASGGPRRVRLAVARIDPWSVMKLSFLLAVAVGVMIVVAAAVTWYTLDGLHVFTSVNDIIATLSGSETFFKIEDYAGFERVISLATMVAVVDVVLLTALATIGAFLYNIVAALVGGVHLTLTDD